MRCVAAGLIWVSFLSGLAMAQISEQPGDWKTWINRGVESFKQGDSEGAVSAFEKAAVLNSGDPVPHLYL